MTKLREIMEDRNITEMELARRLNLKSSGAVNHRKRCGIRNCGCARRYAKAIGCCPLEILEV